MSWFLCLWIAVSCLVLCQATLYETIQQHHVPRPGHNAIQILGESSPELPKLLSRLNTTACILCVHLSPAGFVLVYVVYTVPFAEHARYSAWAPPRWANQHPGLRCLPENAGQISRTVARNRDDTWGWEQATCSLFTWRFLVCRLHRWCFFKVPVHHGKPGNSSSRCPVMGNIWEIRKSIECSGNINALLGC